MNLLLDTHIVYWSFYEKQRLPALAMKMILEADSVYVSSASLLELSIKFRLGKFKADPEELAQTIHEGGFRELPVSFEHAVSAGKLPLHHSDPFDRLLVAQAVFEGFYLVTADEKLTPYSEMVIRI